MAAQIIDDAVEVANPEIEADTTKEVVQTSVQTTQPEDDLPEKYRGKSVKDIVAMHQAAEKLVSISPACFNQK